MPVHTKPETESVSWNEEVQDGARKTPLTEEAKAHLTAAGHLADNRYAYLQAMIESAIEPLVEANRQVGFDVKLSDEEVGRIVQSVEGALTYGHHEIVEPIFSRLQGERPYVEDGDRPHLSLDAVDVRHLIVDLYSVSAAAAHGSNMNTTETQLRDAMEAIGLKAERIAADIKESAGLEIDGGERDTIHNIAHKWGEKAVTLGSEAVKDDEGEA